MKLFLSAILFLTWIDAVAAKPSSNDRRRLQTRDRNLEGYDDRIPFLVVVPAPTEPEQVTGPSYDAGANGSLHRRRRRRAPPTTTTTSTAATMAEQDAAEEEDSSTASGLATTNSSSSSSTQAPNAKVRRNRRQRRGRRPFTSTTAENMDDSETATAAIAPSIINNDETTTETVTTTVRSNYRSRSRRRKPPPTVEAPDAEGEDGSEELDMDMEEVEELDEGMSDSESEIDQGVKEASEAQVEKTVDFFSLLSTAQTSGESGELVCESSAIGNAVATLTGAKFCIKLSYGPGFSRLPETLSNIRGAATIGEIAPRVLALSRGTIKTDCFDLDESSIEELMAGKWYFFIHSFACPFGELRGQILPLRVSDRDG